MPNNYILNFLASEPNCKNTQWLSNNNNKENKSY